TVPTGWTPAIIRHAICAGLSGADRLEQATPSAAPPGRGGRRNQRPLPRGAASTERVVGRWASMTYRAEVFVTLKPVVNDPAGLTIKGGLHALGFESVKDVRAGKYLSIL